jgi:hypothetical protein
MFNRILKRPMFKRGGTVSTQGTGLMSIVEPRTGFKDGYTVLDGPTEFEAITAGGVNLPPLTRKEIEDKLYGGRSISGPSKAELALLIGQVVSTPGGIYEKMKASLPITSKILAGRREAEDKRAETIGSVLTKSALDERMQTIKSSEPGQQQKDARALFDSYTKGLQRIQKDGKTYYLDPNTGQAIPQLYFEREALAVATRTPGYLGSFAYKQALEKAFDNDKDTNAIQKSISNLETTISKNKELAKKNPTPELLKKIENNEIKLRLQKEKYNRKKQLEVYDKIEIPGAIQVEPVTPITPETRANGGRIGYAEGTPAMDTIPMQASPKKVSREQIRASLPAEIGNDVVDLLATNSTALYEFANIQTSEDLVSFNKKYGTNVNLPQNA